ncbi:NUDIX hydrolase [Sphingomonas aracearum]|uniref:GDP-mannose pyrophosphatase n=1 Tax=Sphingomonas aracearum TaxID=2283317 RepID=A0A369W1E3_9SPHN|nr:NUDIX hydrolase [Sphingomonas aracearum]RDE07170.1 NUDIX hydrolase [Sphingomonas aracearum]
MTDTPEPVWEGKYLKVLKQGTWEYAGRTRGIQAAAIIAIHQGQLILIDQFRVPLGRRTLELPAGLVGDETEGESVEASAARELEEETGYRAERIEQLGFFHASPGMVSEGFTLVRAHGLTRTGDGGGVEGEGITVHHVLLAEIPAYIEARRAEGMAIDVKLLLFLSSTFLD